MREQGRDTNHTSDEIGKEEERRSPKLFTSHTSSKAGCAQWRGANVGSMRGVYVHQSRASKQGIFSKKVFAVTPRFGDAIEMCLIHIGPQRLTFVDGLNEIS